MIMSYISNPNSLVLAVTPANQDFTTSEAIKMARDVDKQGLFDLIDMWKSEISKVLTYLLTYYESIPLLNI